MKYRAMIEKYFLIDDAETGALVPFIFNDVQAKYYQQLCTDYDIENKGLTSPVREIILKARKEGFTSLILALFAADDYAQDNPTETEVVSYKDEATAKFRKRYRYFMLSCFAKRELKWDETNRRNPLMLESISKQAFAVDSEGHYELRHNRAVFDCSTANARTGSRGGTKHKILYSEAAHYQDTEKITAGEIIEGGSQQMSAESGWIFIESTANGEGNTYADMWAAAMKGAIRFKPRFYGWQEFYTKEQFAVIASSFTNKDRLKQEYPSTPEEAFIAFAGQFFKEWRYELHVCAPKEIIEPYRKFIMGDYGFTAPAAVYWAYVDPDGVLNIYRELYGSGRTYRALGQEMSQLTPITEKIEYAVFDPAIWSTKGENDEKLTGADLLQSGWKDERGAMLTLQKGDNSRVIGWNAVREYMRPAVVNGKETVKIQVWATCPNLIRTLPKLQYDKNHPEDCDTSMEDHGPDAVRYGVMSKPPKSPRVETGPGGRLGRLLGNNGGSQTQKQDSFD